METENNLTHIKNFFFYFQKEKEFISDISDNFELGKTFKSNLTSVISVLSIPFTISVSRTKLYVYERILSRHLILDAPLPELYANDDEYLKSQTDDAKREKAKKEEASRLLATENALQEFYQEMATNEGEFNIENLIFGFLNDCFNGNNDLKNAANELLKQGTVLLWSSFEVLARDYVIMLLNSNPNKFKEFDLKSIPTETIEQYNFDIVNSLGYIYADQHDWSNLNTITKSLIKLNPENEELRQCLKNSILWKLNQQRHLIVHKRGIIDKKYNSLTDDNSILGSHINISPTDLKQQLECIKLVGTILLRTIK